ncbi:hypothetical protein [Brevundimonas sp. Root1279]|uniref:hypothetical protein n=1 Tax=Brevundimonas sp. Root1279 TaxID=1736443 RepID=UPI0006F58A75|nr:hypothetical protein [Brevundimonas sp. Root1279]KQW83972.1 hypothetical protein ASC65_04935 [Brevundimonas sp. Root1279]
MDLNRSSSTPLHPHWMIPWPSLLIGGAFVAFMGLVAPPMLGFAVFWLVLFFVMPFILVGNVLGGGETLGLILFGAAVLTPLVLPILVAWKARTRAAWATATNWVVLYASAWAGLFASIVRFGEAWPY